MISFCSVSRSLLSLIMCMTLVLNAYCQSVTPERPDSASEKLVAAHIDTIRAKRIEIVDGNGNARVILEVQAFEDMKTAAIMSMHDDNGGMRVLLGASNTDSTVTLLSKDGRATVSLDEMDGEGQFYVLTDTDSNVGAKISTHLLGPALCLGKPDNCGITVVADIKDEDTTLVTNMKPYSIKSQIRAMESRVAELESRLSRNEKVGEVIETYNDIGVTHSIEDKTASGNVIILGDGSIWEVFSLDRIISSLWLPTDDVLIVNSTAPSGGYRYQMINIDEGEKVNVFYLGSR